MFKMRSRPNILICGTPGTGKTTLAQEISNAAGLCYVSIGQVAKENDLHCGFDDQLQCPILDEERVLDELEDQMNDGGNVVDYHSCEFFPQRWFDIVFVLRTDNSILHERLTQRGYIEIKIKNNIECEIFQTILDEARQSYNEHIVHELESNTPDNMEKNIEQITAWVNQWSAD